ncbi:PfkB family carbohydrate kinase [Streptosporangium pseudovulgare]|uniref:Ribokinase n=1 Tax=Streptosporangium pseudovulgare TaxID=35765 RepID=A0ABQ2RAU8_9ACTN|nr:PfkB family carbohydrate kinase [Streptosporangium pseudovulgare]GGQ22606.1 ribokinase [Streptosporangium pseudovulgare]
MRLVGLGDNVADRYADLATMFPGGNAVNVAVYARRAGAETAYWGVTGDDAAGALVRGALAAEGVDVSRVRTEPGPNAWSEVRLKDGDRFFAGSDDGVSPFTLDAAGLDALAGYDLAHTAYSGSLIGQVPQIAARIRLSFDFSHRWREPWAAGLVPHLFLAAYSASQLGEQEAESLVREATAGGARWALATRGGDGALLSDGRRLWRQPAVPCRVVDTLGAGDAFLGTLLPGLLRREGDPEQALRAAAEAAALACEAYGGFGHGAPIPAGSHQYISFDQRKLRKCSRQVGTQ